MTNRWAILFVLFFARTTMAFQFQAVAALSPLMADRFGLSLADIGLLIGLYLAPGIVVAIPGGTIAARLGDKRVVAASLGLMLAGGALMAWGSGWSALVAGRVLAGAGGVVVNVVMTKMVVDWFAGREISTAMAIFINSWPVGIALALLVLPLSAATGGLAAAWLVVLAVIALGLAMFLGLYRAPPGVAPAGPTLAVRRFPVAALLVAGLIWALYNAALAMVFGFGPALLTERGLPLTTASSMTSLFMLVFTVAVPLGGVLADRTGRRDSVIATGLLSFALLIPLAVYAPPGAVLAIFLSVGVLFGLSAGPIVGLPATVLAPEARSFAMGVYFTVYYALMLGAPLMAGALADAAGRVGMVFLFGAGMSLGALVALPAFRGLARATPAPAAPRGA